MEFNLAMTTKKMRKSQKKYYCPSMLQKGAWMGDRGQDCQEIDNLYLLGKIKKVSPTFQVYMYLDSHGSVIGNTKNHLCFSCYCNFINKCISCHPFQVGTHN